MSYPDDDFDDISTLDPDDIDRNPLDGTSEDDFIVAVARLSRDLRLASETLSEAEARYLVQAYYSVQEERIRCDHRVRKLNEHGEPHVVISWLGEQARVLETQVRGALARYASKHRYFPWLESVIGVGPVITAGLISHTHMEHLVTVGHLWSFAGLNPQAIWAANTRRPWNAELKTLCWKTGQSFMKFKNHPKCVYGKVYNTQKQLYIKRNDDGGFVDHAAKQLKLRNWDKTKDAWAWYNGCYPAGTTSVYEKTGDGLSPDGKLRARTNKLKEVRVDPGKGLPMLPPAHIDAMARRYAVKLFLAHYWFVAWSIDHPGETPVLPYPVVHLGHAHVIEPPDVSKYIPKAPKTRK